MLPDEELATIQQPLMTVAPAILVPVTQTGSRALILLLWEFADGDPYLPGSVIDGIR